VEHLRKALIDTDILSMFLRGKEEVKSKFEEYLQYHPTISISILSYYEILSGLKHKDANKQLGSFLKLCEGVSIISITKESCQKSADIYANLKKSGEIIDDVDILIAGICLENSLALVTNNTKHFQRIKDIEIVNWSV
jgi:tRNA(fMet)-specific endonuclease VapC